MQVASKKMAPFVSFLVQNAFTETTYYYVAMRCRDHARTIYGSDFSQLPVALGGVTGMWCGGGLQSDAEVSQHRASTAPKTVTNAERCRGSESPESNYLDPVYRKQQQCNDDASSKHRTTPRCQTPTCEPNDLRRPLTRAAPAFSSPHGQWLRHAVKVESWVSS